MKRKKKKLKKPKEKQSEKKRKRKGKRKAEKASLPLLFGIKKSYPKKKQALSINYFQIAENEVSLPLLFVIKKNLICLVIASSSSKSISKPMLKVDGH